MTNGNTSTIDVSKYSETKPEVEAPASTLDISKIKGLELVKKLMQVKIGAFDQYQEEDSNSPIKTISADNIRRARFHLECMQKAMMKSDLMNFNMALFRMLSALPRNFKAEMVGNIEDMQARFMWETSFTDAVEDIYLKAIQKRKVSEKELAGLSAMYRNEMSWSRKTGVIVETCTDEEIVKIKHMMGSHSKQFINAWKINSPKRDKKFEDYVAKRNITNTTMLWHGSATFNFLSILERGLLLSKACYGMYGQGLYFAPSFDKSRGYCSVSGARWRGGQDSSAFLAIAEVATGKCYDVSSTGVCSAPQGYDCVWAHAGSVLHRDEVIVYNSDACRIKYIVETR